MKAGLLVVLATTLIGTALLQHSLAATGKIYLSPASASVLKGANVKLALRINPGTGVDGVEATVTYDQTKLQFVSVDSSGSAFPIQLGQSGGSGTVQVSRGVLGGTVNSDSLIASITFKSLIGSGSASVSASGNASAGGTYTNPGGGGSALSLRSPSTPRPKPTPQPPANNQEDNDDDSNEPSTPGQQPSTPGSNNDTTKPKLDIKQKSIQLTRATIQVTANEKVKVFAQYGIEQQRLNVSTRTTGFATRHDITFNDKLLVPGTTYYYSVTAEDQKGNKTISGVQSFKTKGYRVTLIIRDKLERILRKKKVTLHSDPITGTTDDNGQVTFDNVAPGNHTLEYKTDSQTYTQPVTVNDTPIESAKDGTQAAKTQNVPAIFANLLVADTNTSSFIVPISVSLAALALAAGAFVLIRRRQRPLGLTPSAPATTPITTPQDYLQSGQRIGQDQDPGSIVRPQQDNKNNKDRG